MQHQQHKPSARPGRRPNKPRPPTPTIVLADDSILQRMMTRALLEAEGYNVLEAADGREVVELAHLAHPDLILMDVAMPSMDGVTAARRIRGESDEVAHVPIVFVTGLGALGDRTSALAAGGNDYLVKPIAERELLRVVARYAKVS